MAKKSTRLLAAIMFTDMVGYTALMQEDEQRAKQNRDRHRKILKESIAKHKGEILQYYGDGTLSIFNSAIEAVNCAIQIQQELQSEPKIPLRIGLHLGDIAYDEEGVYGDGVNLASRIESLAISGSILISGKVFDEVKNHQAIKTVSLGAFELKNVKKPIEIYAIGNKGLAIPTKKEIQAKPKKEQAEAESIQSLAILPFANYTGDHQLEYFVLGMHSSLIGDMGKIGGLRVISKTSSNVYKNTELSVPEIATELNVDAVIEADVMGLGDNINVQFRLISAFPEEKQLWIGDYKEEKSHILNLYNQVTKKIAHEVKVKLTPQEKTLLAEAKTVDKEAYDAYLRSRQYWDDLSEDSLTKALEYLNISIEKDPGWAPLYAGVAQVWVGMTQMGFALPEISGPKIYENINKALELDPDFADSHFINGIIAFNVEWNWEKGEKELLQALAINPNDAMSRIYYAHLLMILQRPFEALSQGQRAVDLDPLNPLILALYAVVLYGAGDRKSAMAHVEKALGIDTESYFAHYAMEWAAYHCEEYEKAFEALKFCFNIENDVMKNIKKIFNEQGFYPAYEEILHHLEVIAQNNPIVPVDMAIRYSLVNQYNKAMDWLEKGYEIHDQNMSYIATGIAKLDSLHDDPRFIAIVEKMNLPMPKD